MDKFREKFIINSLTLEEYEYWILSVRPTQPTIGSLIISLKRPCGDLGSLLSQETEELSLIFLKTERLLKTRFRYDKINYLCLMMVDEQVHFHVIPRYSSKVVFGNFMYVDTGWPGTPDLNANKDNPELSYKVHNDLSKHNDKRIIGYTTGVFDLFHVGHLNILKNAKINCDYLIVGVTTDELAMSRKNKKPIISLEERVEILKQIKYVDKVVIQDDMDKYAAWKREKFDRMFVGSDWKGTQKWNDLEKIFKEVGVEIIYFPYTKTTSSTLLREALNSLIK